MTKRHFILATAGHVDHGKSALVEALTGTDPDRLPEEKARGITIDLGFAELNLNGPNEQRLHVGIVDVPGHEDFVRNMIAGVGSIDLALLVVATDDGWMPQTEEHLQILTYLGVKRALIALTKSDLANVQNAGAQIRQHLLESPFANSQIIPTSIRTGEGIGNLKRALAAEFATFPPPRNIGKPRLFVDRAFTLRGIGTVVTGTLTGGELRRGQSVLLQPQNFPVRIRSIQSHGRDLEVARPGMRTAINLPDVAVGRSSVAIKRGDAITIGDLGSPSLTLDVLLEKSARLNPNASAARPLKNGSSVYIHHGTIRVAAKIALLEEGALGCGESAIAQIRLESPILALLGDRFVVRDPSEQFTVAGGIVLDPDGDRQSFRSVAQLQLLAARAATLATGRVRVAAATGPDDVAGPAFGGQLLQRGGDRSQLNATRRSWAIQPVDPTGCLSGTKWIDVCLQSELLHCGFAQTKTLLVKSNFSADEIAATLSRLQVRGALVLRGEIAADAEKWRDLRLHASGLIDKTHEKHPEKRGLDLVDLRGALREQPDEIFQALISDLCRNDFVRTGTAIARASHQATLPPQIRPAAEKVRTALAAKPFDPPTRKEIVQDQHQQHALRFLIEQGEVIEIGSDTVLARESFAQMKDAVIAFLSKNKSATVSQLRQELQTSRRVIVPLLERLDRDGVTRRAGDKRTLAGLR